MRVLNRSDRRTTGRGRDEGAVAIVVAIVLIVLLGLAAFAVDFGLAYTNKRQLQTSADAAALAAAATYTDKAGDCGTLAAHTTWKNQARAEGNALMAANHPEANLVGDIVVQCDPAGTGQLYVSWVNDDAVDTGLGGVFGVGSVNAERAAAAVVGVPTSGTGLRPFAICSAAIPDDLPFGPKRIDYDGFVSTGQCPEAHNSGNWWTLHCPKVSPPEPAPAHGNDLLVWRIENGCASPLEVVEGQEPHYSDSVALSDHLLDTPVPCAGSADVDCLGADAGNVRSGTVRAAWTSILGDEITFPVICGSHTVGTRPICTPGAVHDAGGSNTQYPIHAFAGAIVCGHQFGNSGHAEFIDTGECAGTSAEMDLTHNKNYLVVTFTHVQMSGGVDPSGCALGDPDCDFGTRAVFMVE